jgi:hypothetical protein
VPIISGVTSASSIGIGVDFSDSCRLNGSPGDSIWATAFVRQNDNSRNKENALIGYFMVLIEGKINTFDRLAISLE